MPPSNPFSLRKLLCDLTGSRTVAITPSKSKESGFAEAKRVCQEYPLAALKEMHTSGVNRPFRFIYMSGVAAERDQNRTPSFRPEYSLMRVSFLSPRR